MNLDNETILRKESSIQSLIFNKIEGSENISMTRLIKMNIHTCCTTKCVYIKWKTPTRNFENQISRKKKKNYSGPLIRIKLVTVANSTLVKSISMVNNLPITMPSNKIVDNCIDHYCSII